MYDQAVTTLQKVVLVKVAAFREKNAEHLTAQQYERGELVDAPADDKPFIGCKPCGEPRKATKMEKQVLHRKLHNADNG